MAKFHITGPDGGTYEVEAPDNASEQDVLSYVRTQTAQSPATPQEPTTSNFSQGPRAFAHGMTGGASDYVEATGKFIGDKLAHVIKPSVNPASFNDDLKQVSQEHERYLSEHPVAGYGAEGVGAITSPIFGGLAKSIGKGIDALAPNIPRYVKYVAEGLGIGGAAGAPMARDSEGGLPSVGGVGKSVGQSAVFGGMMGGAVPAIAETGAATLRGASRAARPLLSKLPQNQDTAAGREVMKAIQADGYKTLDEADAAVTAMGPQATYADLGKNSARLADNMAQNRGASSQLAEKTYGDRSASQGSRLVDSVQDNFSGKGFYNEQAAQKLAKRKAGPLFKQAYAENQNVTSPKLEVMQEDPDIQLAMGKGLGNERTAATANGERFQPETYGVVADFNSAGDPIVKQVNTTPLKLWHSVKQGLDDLIEGYRDSTTGKLQLDGRGNQLVNLRSSLDKELKALTGGAKGTYARANAAYAGPAKLSDAMWRGRAFARGDEEVTADVFGKMTAGEQDAYRTGAARELIGMIRKSGSAPPAVRAALRDTAFRDKLRVIAPTEGKMNKFVSDLEREMKFQQTSNTIRGGSQTFQRGMENHEAAASVAADLGGAAISLAQGNPSGALTQVARYGINAMRRLQIPVNVRDQIGKMLMSNDPATRQEALRTLRSYQTQTPSFSPSRKVIGRLAGPGASLAAMTGGSNQQP